MLTLRNSHFCFPYLLLRWNQSPWNHRVSDASIYHLSRCTIIRFYDTLSDVHITCALRFDSEFEMHSHANNGRNYYSKISILPMYWAVFARSSNSKNVFTYLGAHNNHVSKQVSKQARLGESEILLLILFKFREVFRLD